MKFDEALNEMDKGKILGNDCMPNILYFKYRGKYFFVMRENIQLNMDFGPNEHNADWEVVTHI